MQHSSPIGRTLCSGPCSRRCQHRPERCPAPHCCHGAEASATWVVGTTSLTCTVRLLGSIFPSQTLPWSHTHTHTHTHTHAQQDAEIEGRLAGKMERLCHKAWLVTLWAELLHRRPGYMVNIAGGAAAGNKYKGTYLEGRKNTHAGATPRSPGSLAPLRTWPTAPGRWLPAAAR